MNAPSAWMPGDTLLDNSAFLPEDLPDGDYDLRIAVVDPATRIPVVKLAIKDVDPDGWHLLGKIKVHPNSLAR